MGGNSNSMVRSARLGINRSIQRRMAITSPVLARSIAFRTRRSLHLPATPRPRVCAVPRTFGTTGGISAYAFAEAAVLFPPCSARTKNGHMNWVPLSPLALEIIEQARELAPQSLWLFPSRTGDGPIDAHAPTRALDRARKAIGLNNFRIHDLRGRQRLRWRKLVSAHWLSV